MTQQLSDRSPKRWRTSDGHPVWEQGAAAARRLLVGARLRLAPVEEVGHPHTSRLRSGAGGSWGGRWASAGPPPACCAAHGGSRSSRALR